MGVINSPLVEGRVFSEEVNKKEVTVNGANSNHCLLITDTARTSHFTLQQSPFIIHVRESL